VKISLYLACVNDATQANLDITYVVLKCYYDS
jgi:hypothetical protein